MPIKRIDQQVVKYSYNIILSSQKKRKTLLLIYATTEPHRHHIEWKKPNIVYDSILYEILEETKLIYGKNFRAIVASRPRRMTGKGHEEIFLGDENLLSLD